MSSKLTDRENALVEKSLQCYYLNMEEKINLSSTDEEDKDKLKHSLLEIKKETFKQVLLETLDLPN